jgi:basic amino acid/polyamine antiporter, APA family
MSSLSTANPEKKLSRHLGLLGLAATGICSMIGASIYVVPFMIQRSVPGIGPYVVPAFLFAAIPAVFAAFAYAVLSSAMPRAGGSYIFASRGLHPYLGFVASFSQWFGLSIAIGVVAYVIVPFLRDMALAVSWTQGAEFLNQGFVRVSVALLLLWTFVVINILGIKSYERALVPLMIIMFGLGFIVIITGAIFNHEDFASVLKLQENRTLPPIPEAPFDFTTFLSASAILFASFIGFDSIAQAGGEAKDPGKLLPMAIGVAVVAVSIYYFTFTSAVYHAVPWSFIADEAMKGDITAPGVLRHLIPPGWNVAIIAGAAVALTNDLPAMLLAVSRLVFAWSADGIFPRVLSSIHPRHHTPHWALILSGGMASIGIIGCHYAGDFFLGVDLMVLSMLVNFLVMCFSVITLPMNNPELAKEVKVITQRSRQLLLAWAGVLFLTGFFIIHVVKDLTAPVDHWYFRSTPVWLLVMALGSIIYMVELRKLKKTGIDTKKMFKLLPDE